MKLLFYRKIVVAIFLVIALLLSGNFVAPVLRAQAIPPPPGVTYWVNTALDTPDDNPSNGICADINGKCSLRAAIMQANNDLGADTIILKPGTYQLTRAGHDVTGYTGSLVLNNSITIQGAGSGSTIIDANGTVTGDRAFTINPAAVNVTMSGLDIRNGVAPTTTGYDSLLGGGIYRNGYLNSSTVTTLSLTDIVFDGNSAFKGGGLYAESINYALAPYSQISLTHTTFHNNGSQVINSSGGGLYIADCGLTIQDFRAYANQANYTGGVMTLVDIFNGTISRAQMYNNSASYGGAMEVEGPANSSSLVTLQDSWVHNNSAVLNGGAIEDSSSLTILRTGLDHNTAAGNGGVLYSQGTVAHAAISFIQSTLSSNSAQMGGAIYFENLTNTLGSLQISNSTIADNAVFGPNNTPTLAGGGIFANGYAIVNLVNTTLAGNQVIHGPTSHATAYGAGVVITAPNATVAVQDSLIADNVIVRGGGLANIPSDCDGNLFSAGRNLIQDVSTCTFTGSPAGNITGQDPLLGPLGTDGGETATLPLLGGSPALDAGDNASCLYVDQRGLPRPFNVTCDIGAYEYTTGSGQAIQFDPIPEMSLAASPIVVSAGASSDLQVSFDTTTPAVCSVGVASLFAGITSVTVTLLKPGAECSLTATQLGNSTYAPAAAVTRSFLTFSPNIFLPLVRK